MPCTRNPAHLQAYPTSGVVLSDWGNHYRRDDPMKALAAFWLRFLTLAAFMMIAGFAFVHGQSSGIKVVNLIPASLSGETNQDSEPFLAVQTVNPDRKSTRLNSSHSQISYAVFCLKKK